MIGEILQAIIDECKALLTDTGGTVIFKTDYKSDEITSYTMPLLILDMLDAPDTGQQIGGLTRCDWMFALNSYNYMPNSEVSEDAGFSTNLLTIIDTIRVHFTVGNQLGWLTEGMTTIENNYGFRFSLSGIQKADALDQDGLVLGYRIVFDSLSFDPGTTDLIPSTSEVMTVIDNSRI